MADTSKSIDMRAGEEIRINSEDGRCEACEHDGYVQLDPLTIIRAINNGWLQKTGYTLEWHIYTVLVDIPGIPRI